MIEDAIPPDGLREHIAQAPWKATTYIQPHEYVMEPLDPALWQAIAHWLIDAGYFQKFGSRTYRYVHLDGYKYWIVDNCVNRQRLPEEAHGQGHAG